MHKCLSLVTLLLAAIALSSIAAACGSSKKSTPAATATPAATPTIAATSAASSGGTVSVVLSEWKVGPSPLSIAAGSVTFKARNTGNAHHDLRIIRTDLPATGLPTKADGSADETTLDVVGKTDVIDPDISKSVTVDLAPGNYVLICNIVDTMNGTATLAKPLSHYKVGMTVGFTVTP